MHVPLGSTVERRGGSSPPPCTYQYSRLRSGPSPASFNFGERSKATLVAHEGAVDAGAFGPVAATNAGTRAVDAATAAHEGAVGGGAFAPIAAAGASGAPDAALVVRPGSTADGAFGPIAAADAGSTAAAIGETTLVAHEGAVGAGAVG